MIHSAPSHPGVVGSIRSRWIDITWFCGLGRDTASDGGAMGSVGSIEQESAGQVGSALRLEGPEGSVEFENGRR